MALITDLNIRVDAHTLRLAIQCPLVFRIALLTLGRVCAVETLFIWVAELALFGLGLVVEVRVADTSAVVGG